MFERDPAKRIDSAGIQSQAWFRQDIDFESDEKILVEAQTTALELNLRQASLEQQYDSGYGPSEPRSRGDKLEKKDINEQVPIYQVPKYAFTTLFHRVSPSSFFDEVLYVFSSSQKHAEIVAQTVCSLIILVSESKLTGINASISCQM
jgi:hypothetical protein